MCVGACGLMSRIATTSSSSCNFVDGISPATTRQNRQSAGMGPSSGRGGEDGEHGTQRPRRRIEVEDLALDAIGGLGIDGGPARRRDGVLEIVRVAPPGW